MDIQRRRFLLGSAGTLLFPLAGGARAQPAGSTVFDFENGLPKGIAFRRPTPALGYGEGGLALFDSGVPRIEEVGTPLRPALLVEGDLTRVKAQPGRGLRGPENDAAPLEAATSIEVRAEGERPVLSLPLRSVDRMVTASAYVRTAAAGRWSIALRSPFIDEASEAGVATGPEWTRVAVTRPAYVSEPDPLEFHLAFSAPGSALLAPSAQIWGAQIDDGFRATSVLAPGEPKRSADEVHLGGQHFQRREATVTLHLPGGGTRGGILLDGEEEDFRFGFNNSGRLVARVGTLAVEGFEDASAHDVVQVCWSQAGIGVASGPGGKLLHRAFTAGDPGTPQCGTTVRLLAGQDGERPANTHLARIEIVGRAGETTPVSGPIFVPPAYRMVFGDEFDDPDLDRINENGAWEGHGPFWRSRHRWTRFDAINKEKQVYMDRAFAGSGDTPLGVQPFSIGDGILTITAEKADPKRVRPFIRDAAYTSGMISSATAHSQTYGYFEICCRVPPGRGFWPAFWLLPLAETWPPEIDVLEGSGARRFSFSTGTVGDGAPFGPLWVHDRGDLTESFHVFAMEWTKSEIVLFVDGAEVRRGRNFVDQPMFVVANLAVGSHQERWIPDPDATTPPQGRFEIDYIRCWSRG